MRTTWKRTRAGPLLRGPDPDSSVCANRPVTSPSPPLLRADHGERGEVGDLHGAAAALQDVDGVRHPEEDGAEGLHLRELHHQLVGDVGRVQRGEDQDGLPSAYRKGSKCDPQQPPVWTGRCVSWRTSRLVRVTASARTCAWLTCNSRPSHPRRAWKRTTGR